MYILKSKIECVTLLYNEKKKEYNKLLGECKNRHFSEKIKISSNKSKTTWSIIGEITGKNASKTKFNMNGKNNNIANNFNSFFIDSASELLGNIENVPFSTDIPYYPYNIESKQIDITELIECVKELRNKCSAGCDEISMNLIKFVIDAIATPLCYIINNSLESGIFPDELKLAVVVPVYKKGDSSKYENYRPISMLSSFSKVFEKILSNHIIKFMIETGQLNDCQHGYIKTRSTTTAVFQFINNILSALETGNIPMGIFLDLSKAYDTIDHNILIQKLHMYGIRGSTLQWLRSYLRDRKQRVKLIKNRDISYSKDLTINVGIPQGSVLGPILFILYINDIQTWTEEKKWCSITTYADDTNVLIKGNNIGDTLEMAKNIMNVAQNWLNKNNLILNKDKTSTILFKTKRSQLEEPQQIIFDGTPLKFKQGIRFLGLELDNTFTWSNHIENICKKLSKSIYNIIVLRRYVNFSTLKVVYHAIFESNIRYGIIVYGNSMDIEKLFICQKRALRIMCNMNVRESCRGKFKKNNLLTVTAIFIQECALFFHKNQNLFCNDIPQSVYQTRNCNFNFPVHRLTLTEHGPYYNCIKIYNTLPQYIKQINQTVLFKKELYKYLIDLEPYSLIDFLNA